eukprot:Sspe_Gene.35144::Locus_17048_Transcript_1_1_Confidence_1.000_Length_2297::g.35144::m.35144
MENGVTLDDLLQKVGLSFEKIKGSTKRADVLESLARRAGIDADVIQIAMWETDWDGKVKAASPPPALAVSSCSVPYSSGGSPPRTVPKQVEFIDPVKHTSLCFVPSPSGSGMLYTVNGEPRPIFHNIKFSVHSRGPRIDFPELHLAATIPWDNIYEVADHLREMADSCNVTHNIPPPQQIHYMPRQVKQDGTPTRHHADPMPHRKEDERRVTVDEGEILDIPTGVISRVLSASYGTSEKSVPVTATISRSVQNGGLPGITASAEALGVPDPCPGERKTLEVVYVYSPPRHHMRSPSSSSFHGSPSDAQQNGPFQPPADDGDDDEDTLTEKSTASTSYRHDPYNPNSSAVPVNDGASCTDEPTDTTLTDDEGSWACRRGSETALAPRPEEGNLLNAPASRPRRANVCAKDGEYLHVNPGTIEKVVRAVYGAGDRWVLATRSVRAALANGGIHGLYVSKESLRVADPYPGVPKMLDVRYVPVHPEGDQFQFPPASPSSGVPSYPMQYPPSPYSGGGPRTRGMRMMRAASDAASVCSSVDGPPTLDESWDGSSVLDALPRTTNNLPVTPRGLPSEGPVMLLVQFKYGRVGGYLHTAPLPYGTHVIVEGDRGEDLGMVTDHRPPNPDEMSAGHSKVLRLAADTETRFWRNELAEEERGAVAQCQEIVRKQGTAMRINHAEFQFDMRKLTFYFQSKDPRPDFSQAIQECFRIWQCRIWFVRHSRSRSDDIRWSTFQKQTPLTPEACTPPTPPP